MPDQSRKRPRDTNMLAKMIVDIATGDIEDREPVTAKDPAAVSLGRRGGLKGGPARASKLTPAERRESARKAARARWANRPNVPPDAPSEEGSTGATA
jgi:hypothetical protein